ncbi:unnamed protein product [Paramecium primaurelia]|uniref:Protein kinase domain-containing protein n=1 Tax=Paramecium primaurelia TaxID=5886 RepID=A0A8S1JNY9_PARPR|nr:unnamed protein product [Paramecium primaurelia]
MSLFYKGWFAKIIEIKEDTDSQEGILGHGGYGIVYRGKMKIENINNSMETKEVPIAIKRIQISTDQNQKTQIEYIKRELSVYEQIKSKNIVQLYGSEQKDNYYYLYLELCDGNLLNYITDENGDAPLKEEEALRYFIKIYDTLQLLKNSEYERTGDKLMTSLYHRDINVKNILYKKSKTGNRIKLCDFGISQYLADSDHKNQKRLVTLNMGTQYFMSPENNQRKLYDLEKNETWSLGILLFCLLFGYQLFRNNCIKFQPDSSEDHFKLINQLTDSIEVKQLLFGLLQKDPQNRICYQSIRNSQCYKLYGNTSFKKTYIPQNQFEYLTQLFITMDQNLFNQIPQDLLFMVFYHYKNWVYKQCDNYSGFYKMIDQKDLFLSAPKNLIIYGMIPIYLSKLYQFFQNIQFETQTQNDDQIISFWRKVTQLNKRFMYQDKQKYYLINILSEILDKLQLELCRLQEQNVELNKKVTQQKENKKQEKLNIKIQTIKQQENQKQNQFNQLNELILNLTQYFEWKMQNPYDSQFKQSKKYN